MVAQYQVQPQQEEQVLQRPQNIEEFLDMVSGPTNPEYVKSRKGGTNRQTGQPFYVEFVEWHYVADLLDQLVPAWKHKIIEIREVGPYLLTVVELDIFGTTRQGLGTGLVQDEMGIKKSEHDALKRAAVKFGIARDLYQEEEPAANDTQAHPAQQQTQQRAQYNPPQQGQAAPQGQAPRQQAQGRGGGNPLTIPQRNLIMSISQEINVDPNQIAFEQMQVDGVDGLTIGSASDLIKILQEMKAMYDQDPMQNGPAQPAQQQYQRPTTPAQPRVAVPRVPTQQPQQQQPVVPFGRPGQTPYRPVRR